MAAKPSAPPAAAAAAAAPPAKSKKPLLILIGVGVLVLLLGAVAAFFLLQPPAEEELGPDGLPIERPAAAAPPADPPTFMPMENLVVNLADPGSARFAQIGISLQLADSATATRVEAFMPAIRNGLLRLSAQRTAAELLTPEGKDALAADILAMIRQVTGLPEVNGVSPVQAVLFTSLIVQ